MAATCCPSMTSVPSGTSRPVREFFPGRPFSAEAAEFKPKLSVEAEEFVPKFGQEQAVSAAPQGNCCLISLGAYSDDSDEEEPTTAAVAADAPKATPWRTASVEFVPLAFRGKATPSQPVEPKAETETAFKVSAKEFVPRFLRDKVEAAAPKEPEKEGSALAEAVASESSTKSTAVGGWKKASSQRAEPMSPRGLDVKTPKEAQALHMSESFMSTDAGSASVSGSADDASSTASVSTSRSHSPASKTLSAAISQESEGFTFNMHALLQWRHSAPSERVDDLRAGEHELAFVVSDAPKTKSSQEKAPERRRSQEPTAQETEGSWRNVAPAKKLEVSKDGWVAQQRARRSSIREGDADTMNDEELARLMKSILNKLTVEKFDVLAVQLVHCGIRNALHLELLIHEVFEKATTQHHFIDMYADLCVLLNKQCIIEDNPKMNFKKVLLNCCQSSFEKHLTPPSGITEMKDADRVTANLLYKMRMLGNIRFVGALLVRKMLASKVMLSIMEELLNEPTPEALESLAAFLMSVGPTFDTPDWSYRPALNAIFIQVEKIAKNSSTNSRARCLLKDVIDIRNLGWEDKRPKKIDGPLKLDQVAAKAAMESGGSPVSRTQSTFSDGWSTVPGTPASRTSNPSTPASRNTNQSTTSNIFQMARKRTESSIKEPSKEVVRPGKTTSSFDVEVARKEVSATLSELRVSHDVAEAIERIAKIGVPSSNQSAELNKILAAVAEEGSEAVRKVGFALVAGLFLEKHWEPESATKGLRKFVEETCEDLKCDVPTLPEIVGNELHLALAPLVAAMMLDREQHSSLMRV